ncbi:DNA-formamidopyrimidine glycosylase [Mesoplasma photuris]|uniref:DNA-formamidopyrimidine glycosylase n=1 Tax=Mesoplasma photuris TaxID=217731 RepID=UPI0004E1E131|nr:DNA-formamidopyrimidine glycosylase [Mesoplasma photuris]
MPELPEVTTVAKILNKKIQNTKILDSKIFYTKLLKTPSIEEFKSIIKGQTIQRVTNIAKYLLIELDTHVMVSHLRMEGKWSVEEIDELQFKESWLEAQIHLDNNQVLRYYDSRKFGTLELYSKEDYIAKSSIHKLGPTPMQTDLATPEYLYKITKKSKKAIKTLLLDQEKLAGLGNIYVNEVLFKSKVNPERSADSLNLEEVKAILQNSKEILLAAIEMGGTTFHSFKSSATETGHYQDKLMVHSRRKQACLVCGETILFTKVNGRGTEYCPKCQKF